MVCELLDWCGGTWGLFSVRGSCYRTALHDRCLSIPFLFLPFMIVGPAAARQLALLLPVAAYRRDWTLRSAF